jgi:hypothetical protein
MHQETNQRGTAVTVNDLIRELSELNDLDRELPLDAVDGVRVRQGADRQGADRGRWVELTRGNRW